MSTNLLRRDPLAGFPGLDRFFGAVLAEPVFNGSGHEPRALALDVSETDAEVIVRASVPGFTAEQIDVELHDGVLAIKASREEQAEETTERYYRRERRVGSLTRRIMLPENVHNAEPQARLENGELTLRFPKEPQAQPRKIAIS